MVLRAYAEDPQYAIVASAMLDQAFTVDDRLEMLDRLATTSKLSPGAWSKLFVQAFTVVDPLDAKRASQVFKQLDRSARLPAAAWREIGQRLVAAERPEMGWLAYERAIERGDDPALLGEIGDELAVAPQPHWELSLRAFQKGMERLQQEEQHAVPG